MERAFLKSQKHVLWEALIIAIFLFGIGVLLGIFIENARSENISDLYLQSETDTLDLLIHSDILEFDSINCQETIKSNIEFGDKIYESALTLGNYEGASRITNVIKQQHKKYDTLRTLFWVNSIKIKEKCGNNFHTIVYLYNYEPKEITETTKEKTFSNFLWELKQEKGNEVILIPIARNMGITSLDILQGKYGINQTSIIVDEDLVVSEIADLVQIKNYIS
jgi:hypothetical protein